MGKTVFGTDEVQVSFEGDAIHIARRFLDEMVSLVAEFQASELLYNRIFGFLRDAGATASPSPSMGAAAAAAAAAKAAKKSSGEPTATIYARQVAEVGRRLVEERADPNDPQLRIRATALLSVILGDSVDGRASAIDVDLPNLEDDSDAVIVKDNVLAMAAVYFSAMLEDLKFYDVADKVSEQFMSGILPLSRGPGGESIYEYIRRARDRFTPTERRSIYAQSLGVAQGSVEVPLPNREFSDLWIRFLSVASLQNRQIDTTNNKLLSTGTLVTDEQVFKAAKDLAVNLSLHGYGIGHFAAVEMQKLARDVKGMLSFPDVLSAFGTRDVWQLVERVSQMYLGGSTNGVRQRTMAQCGARIIQFLGNKASALSGVVVSLSTAPIKSDVEQWLAVTGTDDGTVDKYSAPISVSAQPTIPMTFGAGQGMDLVRDALQKVGTLTPNVMNMNNLAKA
jgi:hypothetical protein